LKIPDAIKRRHVEERCNNPKQFRKNPMNKRKIPVCAGIAALISLLFACAGPQKPDPGSDARLYGSHASSCFTGGNFQAALSEYRRAYVAAAKVDLPLLQAQYLFNIGRVYYELGALDSADSAFQASYREHIFYKDDETSRTVAGFIALVSARQGRYDNAFEWYERGRPQELKDPESTAFWLTVQAVVGMVKDRMPEAESYLDRAMISYKKEKKYNGMAQVDYYRAAIAFSSANYEDAKQHLAESLAFLDKSPERYRRWRVLLASATVAFCMHDAEQGQRYYKRALDCVPKGIALPSDDEVTGCPKKFWDGNR
jgi:tetratricopeptide (TPR) repeat protein